MTGSFPIPRPVAEALQLLRQSGFASYVVGGCVRDTLLGKTPSDWDITTDALPEQVHRVFRDFPTIPTGEKHGTVTAVIQRTPIEITTFRTDGPYADHRRPSAVSFARSLEADLARRDFTINALAYHPTTGVIDCHGGLEDLEKKQIRAVGDPFRRFEEDGLRILRGLRFAAQLGFSIAPATESAMLQKRELLHFISRERIQDEFSKLLCGPSCAGVLRRFSSVIFTFLPSLQPMEHFQQNNPYHRFDVWEHTLCALEESPPDLTTRLALLLHDSGKPAVYTEDEDGIGHFHGHGKESTAIAQAVLHQLRYANHMIETVCTLVRFHDMVLQTDEQWIKRQLRRFGEERFFQQLTIHRCDTLAQSAISWPRLDIIRQCGETARKIIASQSCFRRKDLAVNGRDLIALGIPAGKEIGSCLEFLLDAVIDGACPNQRDLLLQAAQHWFSSQN